MAQINQLITSASNVLSPPDGYLALFFTPDNELAFKNSSGSIVFPSGSIATASYALTASYLEPTVTASYALTASYLSGSIESASYALTASYLSGSIESSSYAITASYAFTASYLEPLATASYALTASYISGSISVDTGSLINTSSFNDLTASVAYTGSNQFNGDQIITGSLVIGSWRFIESGSFLGVEKYNGTLWIQSGYFEI